MRSAVGTLVQQAAVSARQILALSCTPASVCCGSWATPLRARTSDAHEHEGPSQPSRSINSQPSRKRALDLDNIPMFSIKSTCSSTPPEPVALDWREVLDKARLFVAEGVTKVRLTGGEPTVRRDLVDLARDLGSLPGLQTLAMTTNGLALKRKLPDLRAAGLTALNISLDTLRAERFVELTRRQGHARVLEAIHTAAALGFVVKVNVVLMRGVNDDELLPFVELTRNLPVNVRFIEYMPFDDNAWSRAKMYTYHEMMRQIEAEHGPLHRCADPRGEVAKNFTLPGFEGSVSFITSMTEHFCSDCNRLRLMADGNLKVCLFGANEVSLRDAMRGGATDDDLKSIISAAIKRKRFAHADMDVLAATKNRAMIKIGG